MYDVRYVSLYDEYGTMWYVLVYHIHHTIFWYQVYSIDKII